jgi:hypothetical protein
MLQRHALLSILCLCALPSAPGCASLSSEVTEPSWHIAEPPESTENTRGGGAHDPAYEGAHRSVVLVTTRPNERLSGKRLSAGVVIHRDGWVLTNAELLTRATPNDDMHIVAYVRFNRDQSLSEPVRALLYRWDMSLDIALLKLDPKPGDYVGPALDPVGDGHTPGIGTTIRCIGHESGLWRFETGTVHASNQERIETDCDLGEHDLGALLLEDDGRLMGIKTSDTLGLPWPALMAWLESETVDEPLEVMP